MPFDLATAKPVDQPTSGGFDLSSARPVDDAGESAAATPEAPEAPEAPEVPGRTALGMANFAAGRVNKALVANTLGAPMDFATNVANLGIAGYGMAKHAITGKASDLPDTLNPDDMVGGSASIERLMARLGVTEMPRTPGEQTAGSAIELGTALSPLAAAGASRLPAAARAARSGVGDFIATARGKPAAASADALKGQVQGIAGQAAGDIEAQADVLVGSARQRASMVRQQAQAKADKIRALAQTLSGRARQAVENDAKRAVEDGRRQADALLEQAQQESHRLRQTVDDLKGHVQGIAGQAAGDVEAQADVLVGSARQKASMVRQQAQAQADQIRARAQTLSGQARQVAENDAKRAVEDGRRQADALLEQARQESHRLRQTADRAQTTAAARAGKARDRLSSVGEGKPVTEVGTGIRERIAARYQTLKAERAARAEDLKGTAFDEALAKERAGKTVAQTKAYTNALKLIDDTIKNPDTSLVNTSVPAMRTQLTAVKTALKPDEGGVSFQGLDNLRRFLRDRASGLPAEGFDAISQHQARELAKAVEGIQEEFSPGIRAFLNAYREDSERLAGFKTKLGKAVVGQEEFDPERFVTDPAHLPGKFFKSRSSVSDLKDLMGGDEHAAEEAARAHVMDGLRNADSKAVAAYLDKARDWIGEFPALRRDLVEAQRALADAEKVGGKREALAKARLGQIGDVQAAGARGAARAEQDAGALAERTIRGADTRGKQIERAGAKLAGEAERPIAAAEAEARSAEGQGAAMKAKADKLRQGMEKLEGASGKESVRIAESIIGQMRSDGLIDTTKHKELLTQVRKIEAQYGKTAVAQKLIYKALVAAGVAGGILTAGSGYRTLVH